MDTAFKDMERHNKIPRGFLVLFFGLIAWGVYYLAAYTPEISGWSQYKVVAKQMEADRANAASAAKAADGNPYRGDGKAIEEGKAIFLEKCADCHGADARGGDGPPLTGALRYGAETGPMLESVAKGRPDGMPPFGTELGTDRIRKVLAFVDSVRERGEKP